MKRIGVFSVGIVLLIGVITSCKSKSNTPSPAQSSSGFLTVSGTTQNLSVTYNNSQPYHISGTASTGIYSSLTASFVNGQPTSGFNVTFPSSNPNLQIYDSNGSTYNASSGSATIQVSSSFTTTITFSNVTFTNMNNASQTIVATGQLINVN